MYDVEHFWVYSVQLERRGYDVVNFGFTVRSLQGGVILNNLGVTVRSLKEWS
jgi:hypothetical protein